MLGSGRKEQDPSWPHLHSSLELWRLWLWLWLWWWLWWLAVEPPGAVLRRSKTPTRPWQAGRHNDGVKTEAECAFTQTHRHRHRHRHRHTDTRNACLRFEDVPPWSCCMNRGWVKAVLVHQLLHRRQQRLLRRCCCPAAHTTRKHFLASWACLLLLGTLFDTTDKNV